MNQKNLNEDQASMWMTIAESHVRKHGGKPLKGCEFCDNFLIFSSQQLGPFETYQFIIMDLSDKKEEDGSNR